MPVDRPVPQSDVPRADSHRSGGGGLQHPPNPAGWLCLWRPGLPRLGRLEWILLGLALLVAGGEGRNCTARAVACPACLGPIAPPLSLAQKVVNCQLAVRAIPTNHPRRFRLLAPFKGEPPTESLLELAPADAPPLPPHPDRESLLGYETLARRWIWLGEIAPGYADWLERLAPLRRSADLTSAEWLQRAELFLEGLGSQEPLVAETAFRELVRTPYATMRELRPRLSEELLFKTLDPDRQPDRRALAALLLGITGTPAARAYITRELAPLRLLESSPASAGLTSPPAPRPPPHRASPPATPQAPPSLISGQQAQPPDPRLVAETARRPDLAALLTAHLELHGPSALPAVVTRCLLPKEMPPPLREAVVLACRVQGTANSSIPREQVAGLFTEWLADPNDTTRPWAPVLVAELESWSDWRAVVAVARLRATTPTDDPACRQFDRYLKLANSTVPAR